MLTTQLFEGCFILARVQSSWFTRQMKRDEQLGSHLLNTVNINGQLHNDVQWFADKSLITGSSGTKAFIRSICQFLWCKYVLLIFTWCLISSYHLDFTGCWGGGVEKICVQWALRRNCKPIQVSSRAPLDFFLFHKYTSTKSLKELPGCTMPILPTSGQR